ncbi:MAG: hypothetical protein ACI4DP_04920 [Candidatus Ornithomonoglobus sp.]
MYKRKIKNMMLKILKCIFVFMLTVILIVCLFLSYMRPIKQYLFPNTVNILFGICFYAVVCVITYLIGKKLSYKNSKRIILIMSILSVFYLFFISLHYCFATGWDCGTILENAKYLAHDMTDSLNIVYYSSNPNNILLTFFYSLLYRLAEIFGMNEAYFLILFVQCIIYSASGYFIYRAADIYFSEKGYRYSMAVWIIYMLLIGNSPWIIIPYSDSMGLIFVTACILCYFKIKEGARTIPYLIIITSLSVLGYFMKPQICVFAIALIIIEITDMVKNVFTSPWTFIRNGMTILLSAVLALCFMTVIRTACHFDIEKEERLGMAHFIMMGLNSDTYGSFSSNDVLYSQSYHTRKERDIADISKAAERVDELGFLGVIDMAIYKTLMNYNDGTCSWWIEGSFFMQEYPHINDPLEDFLCQYFYRDGKYYIHFHTIMQIIWLGTIFFMIFAARSNEKKIHTLILSVIGVTLFVLIFEARARYLLTYVPMYILLAVIGIQELLSLSGSCWKKLTCVRKVSEIEYDKNFTEPMSHENV